MAASKGDPPGGLTVYNFLEISASTRESLLIVSWNWISLRIMLQFRDGPVMQYGCDHRIIGHARSHVRIIDQQVLVRHLVRKLLIDILIVQQPWPAEHHAQILVQCVHAPKGSLPKFLLHVSALTLLDHSGRPFAM